MIADAAYQEVVTAPQPAEAERSTHHVVTPDGIRIAFDLYHQPRRDTVLIICPGFFQSKNAPTFRRLAGALAHERDVICLDFRGHGDSGGFYTFSAREDADLEAVLRWTRQRYPRVVLLGFSLGAATAINVVSRQGGVDGLVAVSAPLAVEAIEFRFWTPEAIRTGLHGLESQAGCRPGNLWLTKPRPLDHIHALSPTPVLLIHGTHDRIIFPRHSQQLYAQAVEPRRLLLIDGGGHAEELYRQEPERFLTVVQDWLHEVAPP